MKKLILLLSLSLGAQDIITKDYTQLSNKMDSNHFSFHSDVSIQTYKSENEMTGFKKASVAKDDSVTYLGPTLGFSYRFFLNHRISTVSRVDGFYYFSKKRDLFQFSEDYPEDVLKKEDSNTMYGAKFSQSLVYRIPVGRKIYFEPYIIGSLGFSLVRNSIDYDYDEILNTEGFVSKTKESLINTGLGVGFNIMSKNGLFVYMQGVKNFLSITNSKKSTTTYPWSSGTAANPPNPSTTAVSTPETDTNTDSSRDEFSASLGFGYVF